MLIQLSIQDFALIDQLNIEFSDDLNVLTGETGAGKSIIIDAVSLLLGARGQSEFIRTGKDKAYIQGTFLIPPEHPLEDDLQDTGFTLEEDRLLILAREISANGRNVCRINNRIVTLALFKEIAGQLINIYGQHDFQALSQAEKHRDILDSLGGEDFQKHLHEVEAAYTQWKKYEQELNKLEKQLANKVERIDFLKFQIDEIVKANLSENEDEEIKQELALLDNWEKIFSVTEASYDLLYGHDSAYDKISQVATGLNEIKHFDGEFNQIKDNLESIIYQIEESARFLKNYSEKMDFQPERKEYLQERKYLLDKLKRKYGGTIKEIIDFQKKSQKELEELENSEVILEDIKEKTEQSKKIYLQLAEKLSQLRKNIALNLEKQIIEQLQELAMSHTVFKVDFKKIDYSAKGFDNIEFLISPNPGEPLKPLAKIASGGEMSRIMLALKVILANKDNLTTIIFDEIDSGIGGRIVVKVAEKLKKVAQKQQVICVTHSPHIANLASEHFRVLKTIKNNKTFTQVEVLNEEQRVEELARMLGGEEEVTNQHAREMRKKAKQG